ncbi:MAG: hypothetical protein HY238_12710 [Acidobacteria bacterium]|nr:hypothetical protein [Acidobacteriota bacterium]
MAIASSYHHTPNLNRRVGAAGVTQMSRLGGINTLLSLPTAFRSRSMRTRD